MSALLQMLASYVPALLARRFAADPAPLTAPEAERFPAAVLFADISGFTVLAERLTQYGPAGAEELAQILNNYFGQLIELVTSLGGDIIKFVGDAALVLWPAKDEPLDVAICRAAQCGLTLQTMLHNYKATKDVRLFTRISIGAGEVLAASVGGVFRRWEFLVAGNPLVQVGVANQQAQPGNVVLSPEAYSLVQDRYVAQTLPSHPSRRISNLQAEDIRNPPPPRPLAPLVLGPEMEEALRAYIPSTILSRLDAGQTGWLAELRRVTVLFLDLTGLNYNAPYALDQLQAVIQALEGALYHYEGSINQFIVDDKGTHLVAAFGLPPRTHEDDAVRGAQAAQACLAELGRMGLRGAVGVATGRVFCGERGNERRREYAMIGDAINLAARLAQAASMEKQYSAGRCASDLPILCDATTYEAAQTKVEFKAMPALTVKGRARPVAVYHPLGGKKKVAQRGLPTTIVGRVREQAILTESLQELLRGISNIIIIEGEAGIGKSRLVDDMRQQAEAMYIGIFSGMGDAIEKSTSYHAWRGVFSQMFDLNPLPDPEAQRRHFLDLLATQAALQEGETDLLRLAPLLNPVLPFSLPDNDLTTQMTGQVRADNTRKLLIKLLQDSISRSPKAIILEDAHWLDPASWALALAISQQVHPLLLVIAARPISGPLPTEYTQLLQAPDLHHLYLQALSPEETLALVCQRLGVASLPKPAAELIHQKAEGNPFFSEELAYALRDSGFIKIVGRCQVAPGVDLGAVSLPDTVQGVITSRIDQLTPPHQLTLKVASVIGRSFAIRTLHDIYPIEADRPHLHEALDLLEQSDFVLLDRVKPEPVYVFKHILTQEVVYNLMLFAQRQQLHQAIAEWYEQTYAADLPPYYPLLAHHYHYAGEARHERHYAQLAGEQAAARFANVEAQRYLGRALELTPETDKAARYALLSAREKVYDIQGAREAQMRDLASLEGLAQAMNDNRLRAEAALRQAYYAEVTDDYVASIGVSRAAIRLALAAQDTHSEAAGYLQWGRALWYQGKFEAAKTRLKQALALAQEAHLQQMQADSLRNLGVVSSDQGDYAMAKIYLEQSLGIFRELDDLPGGFDALNSLGIVSNYQGDYDEARTYYRRALRIARKIGDRRCEGIALNNLGTVLVDQRDYAEARVYWEQALAIYYEINNRWGQGMTLNNLGFVSHQQGDYTAAKSYWEQAMHTLLQIGNRQHEGEVLSNLGLLFHHLGDDETACEYSQRALLITQELGLRPTQGEVLTHLGHALAGLGHLAEAADAYRQAVHIRQELGESHLVVESLTGLARVSLLQEDLAQALVHVEEVLSYLENDSLDGTEEPARIYLTCYRVLRASQDPRTQAILDTAYHLLQEWAASISDEAMRRSFLENVASHREIIRTWEAITKKEN